MEGILLAKTPYKERDLIAKILLRTGKKISVVFHGGRGGGKKLKGSVLELGFMLSFELNRSNKNHDLHVAKDWSVMWHHQKIRLHHKAFYLLCFYLETIQRLSVDDQLHDEHREFDREQEGLFRVLSNALFYLDQHSDPEKFVVHSHFMNFIGKLLMELGLFPHRERCGHSDVELVTISEMILSPQLGAFASAQFADPELYRINPEAGKMGRRLWEELGPVYHSKYKDMIFDQKIPRESLMLLFDYLCYQLNWYQAEFKTLPMIL
jgi:DNA repair protein RecO